MARIRALARAALAGLLVAALSPGAAHAATDGQGLTFAPTQPVYTVDPGSYATISLTLTTSDGRPLNAPAGLSYGGASLLFDRGTPSGSPTQIVVAAPAATGPGPAAALPLDLRADGARISPQPLVVVNAHGLPYLDSTLGVERRIGDLLGRMTLADKVGQMTQAGPGVVDADPSLVAGLRLGAALTGDGAAASGYASSTPLQIPLLTGNDGVTGATVFPPAVGLGATRDPSLIRQAYQVTAEQMRARGLSWVFAPCVCVARADRSGASFGEDPALVSRMETSIDGLRAGGVLATARDFTLDGADRAPAISAVRDHHVGAVMPSLSGADPTGALKQEIGFTGFVVSAAPAPTAAEVDAGVDMFRQPGPAPVFQQALTAAVEAGRVPMSRIDDAVRRILRTKFELGLLDHAAAPAATTTGPADDAARQAVARRAVAESQVLLKNAGGLLPLAPSTRLYVAGRDTTILDGVRQTDPWVTYSPDASAPFTGSDVGLVVAVEAPGSDTLPPGDRAAVSRVCTALPRCVVLVVSSRPQRLTDQLPSIAALVASWRPGSESAGVADVLFGRTPFTGRLPVTWPASATQLSLHVGDAHYRPLYPYGWGLRTDPGRARLVAAAGPRPSPAVAALLAPANWNPDGSLHVTAATLHLASGALADPSTRDAVLSVVRDAAQTRALSGRAGPEWARELASADEAEQAGSPAKALTHLRALL